ncbi:hypothetical protein BKA70DRAFT_1570010 [Coprinopsis sp. MPI-PUGE-AT-0042]|nr:hypothetical protein BKA70DRAFT_1570010 [Coprinopsis sp. MPI-PUGE-AT-0042]
MDSTSPSSRWVVVDDLDSSVLFNGSGWFTKADAFESLGQNGSTYLGTLHGTTSDSQLSFEFKGSAVKMYGTNNPLNESEVAISTWECFIDGLSTGSTPPSLTPSNNWIFCDWSSEAAGEHILTVQVTPQGQTFWVDRLEYIPLPNASLGDEWTILVDHTDNAITYNGFWGTVDTRAHFTAINGHNAEFEFVGTKLSWWGLLDSNTGPNKPTTGTYAIDRGPPTTFALENLLGNEGITLNQQFFETPLLPQGLHHIKVTFQGTLFQTTALTLSYLLIQGGSLGSASPIAGGTSLSVTDPSPTNVPSASANVEGLNHGDANAPVGVIAGGVVGGVAVIALTIILLLLLRHRRYSNKPTAEAGLHPVPYLGLPAGSTLVYPQVPIRKSPITTHTGSS